MKKRLQKSLNHRAYLERRYRKRTRAALKYAYGQHPIRSMKKELRRERDYEPWEEGLVPLWCHNWLRNTEYGTYLYNTYGIGSEKEWSKYASAETLQKLADDWDEYLQGQEDGL